MITKQWLFSQHFGCGDQQFQGWVCNRAFPAVYGLNVYIPKINKTIFEVKYFQSPLTAHNKHIFQQKIVHVVLK